MKKHNCETGILVLKTPLGWAGVAASGSGITRVILPKADRKAVERELKSAGCGTGSGDGKAEKVLTKAGVLLQKYFSGHSVLFDLPLDLRYYTPFQQRVWKTCAEIPFGETRSYQWIAERLKKPRAARAVGQAMGANPAPVLVP